MVVPHGGQRQSPGWGAPPWVRDGSPRGGELCDPAGRLGLRCGYAAPPTKRSGAHGNRASAESERLQS